MKNYKHFSYEERKVICSCLQVGMSISKIAQKLLRHRSCVYREIKRNQVEGYYVGSVADDLASKRYRKSRHNKIRDNAELSHYILNHLKEGWSPEQIAGRLKLENNGYYVCHESIYRYIYFEQNKEWYGCLRYKKKDRQQRYYRQKQVVRYNRAKSIHEREPIADQFGHWEGDTIGFKGSNRVNIVTLVEKETLYVLFARNTTKTSDVVVKKITEIMGNTPKKIWKTMTFDQGAEFADFRRIERSSKCLVYFCDPHSPWQRGCNENTNNRIRRYLPKETDIMSLSENDILDLNTKMNNTPRKKLGYLTPSESLVLRSKSYCRT